MGEKSLRQYLRAFQKWWWLLVVSAILPVVVSGFLVYRQPLLYQAKATVMVGTSLQNPSPDVWQINLSQNLANAYAELVRQRPVTEAVIQRLGLSRTPDQLANQIGTYIYAGANLLEIRVVDSNPEAAALIANTLADELIRRSPGSQLSNPAQQEFIRGQMNLLEGKIEAVGTEIDQLTADLANLTSAAEIRETQDRISALEAVRATYQTTYANLLASYHTQSPNALALFSAAEPPTEPLPRRALLIMGMAGLAGLALAVAAVVVMEMLDTTLRWEEDGVAEVLQTPVLGAVPQVSRSASRLATLSQGAVAEGVRTVRANIFLARPDSPPRTLLLTSPNAGEGKSFVLASLATVLASAGSRVIAVDADLRRPTLHEFFDQPNVTGLADMLARHDDNSGQMPTIPLQKTPYEGLLLLPAGRPPNDPSTMLTSPRLPALLERLREQADVVLIDSPPVLGPPDAVILATLVEGTVLVVSAGMTTREAAQRARGRLITQHGVNLLGLAFNRVRLNGSYYYYKDKGHPSRKNESAQKEWLTIGEAAARLGVGRPVVQQWCRDGRLATRRVRLRRLISGADVTRLVQAQAAGEHPPAGQSPPAEG
jgi:succinoglycan biosynthesis transport protein ExoP